MQDLGILDCLPWKLRERISKNKRTIHLLSEAILLTVCGIPDIIRSKKKDVDCDIVSDWPAIRRRRVICQEQSCVSICKWYASHVPENQHKSEFLVRHVPIHRH